MDKAETVYPFQVLPFYSMAINFPQQPFSEDSVRVNKISCI